MQRTHKQNEEMTSSADINETTEVELNEEENSKDEGSNPEESEINADLSLRPYFKLAKAANQRTRQVIPFEKSYTQPLVTGPGLFSLRAKIRLIREQKPSFEEVFKIFLLTSIRSYIIHIRLNALSAEKYHAGNCSELTDISNKHLRRLLKDEGNKEQPSIIKRLSIKYGDHVISEINEKVILDTLNQTFYPSTQILSYLKCYSFDWVSLENHDTNDPHKLTPFTDKDKLILQGSITCFTDGKYNKKLIDRFYIKLDIIESSFRKYANSEDADEFAKTLKKYKNEAQNYDFKNLTNLDVERSLDRILKRLSKIENFVPKKADLFYDIIINMHYSYETFYEYFKHLIYLEPLFSNLINYMLAHDSAEIQILQNQLCDPDLLDKLLHKTLTLRLPILDKSKIKKFLLAQGADVNYQDQYGWTALHYACREGSDYHVKELIKLKASATVRTDKTTYFLPLHVAVIEGNTSIVSLLLDYFPDVINEPDVDGFTALHIAVDKGHTGIVKELLDWNGLDLMKQTNKDKLRPFHLAVIKNHTEIIKLLLECSPYLVNCQDGDGWTALHFLAQIGNVTLFEKLLRCGADPEMRTNSDGFSPLHVAIGNGHVAFVKLVLDYRPDLINIADDQGFTLLHFAVDQGKIDIVKILMERKADLNIINANGYTPLGLAEAFSNTCPEIFTYMKAYFESHPDEKLDTHRSQRSFHG